jgi:hypothetical protein
VIHDLPVHSVGILLRPQADSPRLTGRLVWHLPGAPPHAVFHYQTLRVWQVPVEQLLAGGMGTLPLAPLSALGEMELPTVIHRMHERLERGRARRAADVWATTYVLLGLRFAPHVARMLLREVLSMKESSTYQAIVAEASADEARQFLLRLGRKRLGPPSETVANAVRAIADVKRLERIGERLLDVKSWEELLGLPPVRSRRRKERR